MFPPQRTPLYHYPFLFECNILLETIALMADHKKEVQTFDGISFQRGRMGGHKIISTGKLDDVVLLKNNFIGINNYIVHYHPHYILFIKSYVK